MYHSCFIMQQVSTGLQLLHPECKSVQHCFLCACVCVGHVCVGCVCVCVCFHYVCILHSWQFFLLLFFSSQPHHTTTLCNLDKRWAIVAVNLFCEGSFTWGGFHNAYIKFLNCLWNVWGAVVPKILPFLLASLSENSCCQIFFWSFFLCVAIFMIL